MQIYKITNLINKKIYIRKTGKTLNERFKGHTIKAFGKYKSNSYFHNAIRKYGKENFIIENIEFCNLEEELSEREKYWIRFYNSTNNKIGYNLALGGNGGNTWINNPNKEITHAKMSFNIKNRSQELKDKFRYANKEKNFTIEHRKNLGVSSKRNIKILKKCIYCGKEGNKLMIGAHHNKNCKLNPSFNKKKIFFKDKNCINCNTRFSPKNTTSKFCSDKCRKVYFKWELNCKECKKELSERQHYFCCNHCKIIYSNKHRYL